MSAAEATSATRSPPYHPTCHIVVAEPIDCTEATGIEEEFTIYDFTPLAASEFASLPVISTDWRGTSFTLVQ